MLRQVLHRFLPCHYYGPLSERCLSLLPAVLEREKEESDVIDNAQTGAGESIHLTLLNPCIFINRTKLSQFLCLKYFGSMILLKTRIA
jgi:hypothetical protein